MEKTLSPLGPPSKRKRDATPELYHASPNPMTPILERSFAFSEAFGENSFSANEDPLAVLRESRRPVLASNYDLNLRDTPTRDSTYGEEILRETNSTRDDSLNLREPTTSFSEIKQRVQHPLPLLHPLGMTGGGVLPITRPGTSGDSNMNLGSGGDVGLDGGMVGMDDAPGVVTSTGEDGGAGPETWDGDILENNRPKQGDQPTPLEKLTKNQYLYFLRHIESKLKGIRARIIQRDLQHMDVQLSHLRFQIDRCAAEFELLKSNHYLRAGDFTNLLSLEEFITSTLAPQLSLYELDYQQLTDTTTAPPHEVPVFLSIVNQESAGPIFKEKAIGPITLRLLTGATITQIQSGPVQPELVDTSQRIRRNNQELENVKQNFQENGSASFTELKFSSGTFPNLVRLKFRVTIQILVSGQRITKTIESVPTKPFISMTNTGSQWKEAAGTWLKEELFRDSYEVSIARLWNYFQKHYLVSTKQEISNIKRPLYMKDFEYLLYAKFQQSTNKKTINQKEFNWFWDWIGPGLKKIRYQKYLLWLFESGYLAAFVNSKEAEEQLKNETPGTFLIRLSERLDGELIISYVHGTGIRHYLIQPDDTADKKKTLIDFLGQNKIFVHILQISTQPTGKRVFYKHNKDKVLMKYYKKQAKQTSSAPQMEQNPYDTRLPVDLNSLLSQL